jgi:hypothetical protein
MDDLTSQIPIFSDAEFQREVLALALPLAARVRRDAADTAALAVKITQAILGVLEQDASDRFRVCADVWSGRKEATSDAPR